MGNPSKRDKSILKVIYTDFAHKKMHDFIGNKGFTLSGKID